ncbi:hypothetical protein [Thalassospira sp.]|uniref:hypothetical protein n=1 Tax=Thalassospira sp. TaxID=1912094 RepID=UPI001B0DDE51|nr:hypothetical protein [Thalassospira sp.]MBO6805898.1 hypothetical protein [Thalassospira sp.]
MKTCSKCSEEKPAVEFGLRRRSPDGLQAWCRDCRREYQRDYIRQHRDLARHRESQNRYRIRHREKHRAHGILRKAVQSGRMVVPTWCQRCGCVTELEAHHHDYGKPLAVEWLCSICHGLAHRSGHGGAHAGL